MKPAPFAYHRAENAASAIALLKECGSGAKLLAGGQSLGPMLNFRIVQPTDLIDIRRIAALREIRTTPSGGLWIGAAVTHAAIEDGATGDPFLARIAAGIAYRAVRNRGTIGGSLVQADPAADWPAVICALEAVAHILSPSGERSVPMEEFFVDQLQTVLTEDEILLGIERPAPANTRYGFAKITPKSGEFAQSLAVVALKPGAEPLIWLGAAAPTPTRIPFDDTALIRTLPKPQTPSDRYRHHLHTVTIARALADASQS
jgi:carbon-monoxide dehydrogenase medium subunit